MEETTGNPPQNPQPESTVQESPRPNRVKDLFSWRSLSRPVWQFNKDVYTTFGAIAILVAIIFAFFQEWMAIFVVGATYFLFYALSKVPPVEVDHKITTEGIVSINKSYIWNELGPFWFSHNGKELILHVAHRNLFGQLILIVNPADQEKIRDILAEYLPFIEVPEKSMTEKMSDWFSKKFPLEKMVAHNFKPTTNEGPTAPPPAPPLSTP